MSKVPFALELDTQKYVDVHDVKRGLKCNCICPSCKTPLSAKQGDENAWHFAHATRSTSDKTVTNCEYSFYVSVTQMAKQLFMDRGSLSLSLPAYNYRVQSSTSNSFYTSTREVLITEASSISLNIQGIETKLSRHAADVLGKVRGFPFIIIFTHPEKRFEIDIELLDGERAGIIGIDLTDSVSIFHNQKGASITSFKEALSAYLFDEIEHIKWLYHPRESSVIEKAAQHLEKESSIDKSSRLDPAKEMDFIDRALAGFHLNRGK
ncbi:competence protein CoiA family protein [Neptuniibacter marinus]|uniref:competence protein CoiA family protein n=1 Tax=Neptuniibacter marinus TaxID=1806670 RepID=UPI000836C3AC|nr:competence protein CoiA family protein [Neptuniibacter marinus]